MKARYALLLALFTASCANCDDSGGTLVCEDDEIVQDGACVRAEPDVGDRDGDGVPDGEDNCPDVANPDQADADNDSVGDACDDCPDIANVSQQGCPADDYDPGRDSDGDGTPDVSDNCPDVPNPDQADSDGDSIGDACDGCPTIENEFADDVCADNSVNPMVNTLAPSIYMLVDASGSMGNQLDMDRPKPWPMDEFKDAITMLPDDLLNGSRVGIGQFPFQNPPDTAATCTFEHLVDVEDMQAQTIRDAASDIEPWGDTPTGYALQQIAAQGLLDDANDPQNASRPKAVVLVTDGDPTVACDTGTPVNSRAMAQPEAIAGAQALAAQGIPVFVVGFKSGANPAVLDEIAEAGGTDAPDPARRHFVAENAQELVATLQSIREVTANCSYEMTNTTPAVDELIVEVNGAEQNMSGTNGYSYDETAAILTLNGSSCDLVQNAADPSTVEVAATLIDRGTAPLCESSPPEVCDYVDNDCDGEVDEGCPAPAEICDGIDNDLDGQTDEGCP